MPPAAADEGNHEGDRERGAQHSAADKADTDSSLKGAARRPAVDPAVRVTVVAVVRHLRGDPDGCDGNQRDAGDEHAAPRAPADHEGRDHRSGESQPEDHGERHVGILVVTYPLGVYFSPRWPRS